MCQTIRLPASSIPYPDSSRGLDTAERMLLLAMRSWVAAHRKGEDPVHQLARDLDDAVGVTGPALAFDTFMRTVARTLRRSIAIHCPQCPGLSVDEKHLLHAASLAQMADTALAETALRRAMLSTFGAEFAVGPLEGVTDMLLQAGFVLRYRTAPGADATLSAEVPAYGATDASSLLH